MQVNFSEFLKRNRKQCVRAQIRLLQLGWTRQDLALKINRDSRQIGNILNGNTHAWPIRCAINQALGATIFTKAPANFQGAEAKKARSAKKLCASGRRKPMRAATAAARELSVVAPSTPP